MNKPAAPAPARPTPAELILGQTRQQLADAMHAVAVANAIAEETGARLDAANARIAELEKLVPKGRLK